MLCNIIRFESMCAYVKKNVKMYVRGTVHAKIVLFGKDKNK